MVSKEEYSLMSADVYNDARGVPNQLDLVPLGWNIIKKDGGSTGGIFSSGLSINAYKKGNEIVIACKGTDFLIGSNNSQTASDLIADVALGGSLGFSSSQLFQAALFYQRVKEQNPGATFTFTGHSLGAGLASILSVWFNKPATIFADAPFEVTALNPLVMGYVAGFLALNGYSDPEFVGFINSYIFTYGARESQVTSYYVKDEVLNNWLGLLPFVVGNNEKIDVGGTELLSPLTLHSIVLHSSLVISEQLRLDTIALPRLLARMFDEKLYAFKLESAEPDFLTQMLKAQIPLVGGDMSSGQLTHFASDMKKLGTSIGGLVAAAQDALVAQGIEWYYWQGTNYKGEEFFSQTGALLQYTTAQGADLTGALNKAARYVDLWLNPIAVAHGTFGDKVNYDQWNVVAGSAGSTATAKDTQKSQIFIGGAGGDTFTGGNKADTFYAGTGNDILDGGAADNANDWLYGGAGNDIYVLRAGSGGMDTVIDADGQGAIKVITADGNATILGGGTLKKISSGSSSAGAWQSEDKRFIYATHAEADGSLTLSISGNGVSAMVKNFKSGDLGITLPGSNTSTAATPPAGNKILGDLAPVDFDAANDGVQSRKDALGNVITDPQQAEPDRADALYDSAANDEIIAGGGADTVEATRGGNNWIKAGGGRDVVRSGAGNDVIELGAERDTGYGGAGDDDLLLAINAIATCAIPIRASCRIDGRARFCRTLRRRTPTVGAPRMRIFETRGVRS